MLPRVELEEDCVADEGDVGLDAGGGAGAGAERGHGRRGRGAVGLLGDKCQNVNYCDTQMRLGIE